MIKIKENTIESCGGGIKVGGDLNVEIEDNQIHKTKVGIEVDETITGTIANNNITEASQHAILVKKVDPYTEFGISTEINKRELYELFKKLDDANISQHDEILKESNLAKIDQFTSIAERLLNFSKEYGPVLLSTFAPYLM